MTIQHGFEGLIPASLLRSIADEIGVESLHGSASMPSGAVGEALTFVLVLERFTDRLRQRHDECRLFYTRVYWFERYLHLSQTRDAGMRQQAYQVLEAAPGDVDWATVASILEAAKTA